MNRKSIMAALVQHYLSQPYRPEYYYSNVVEVDGQYLGPYIPYVGEYYPEAKPRILMYAMAQNLNRVKNLMRVWLRSSDKGLLRQYYDSDTPHIHVYPYDNGRLKVIAALVLSSYQGTSYKPTDNVNTLVAVTNFVKFSFCKKSNGKTFDINSPLDIYDKMWHYYCKYEIELLEPDIIVTVGRDVTLAVNKGLKENRNIKPIVVGIPFPGRLNLNAQWIPDGKRLIKLKQYNPQKDIDRIKAAIKGTPDRLGKTRKAIETDWYYFREMEQYFMEVLGNKQISNRKLKPYCCL